MLARDGLRLLSPGSIALRPVPPLTCADSAALFRLSPASALVAGLLMRLGFTAPPGFKSPSLRPLTWNP